MKKILHTLSVGTLIGLFFGFAVFLNYWVYMAVLSALLFMTANLIWTLLPLHARDVLGHNRARFVISISVCLFLGIVCGVIINDWFPGWLEPISLLADAVIVLFTIFLGWGLVRQLKKEVLLIGMAGFILFVYALASFGRPGPQNHDPASRDSLRSLPYLSWTPAKNIEKAGVTQYKKGLAYEGLNLYSAFGDTRAFLMDMTGRLVHVWSDGTGRWEDVEMYDGGSLLRIDEDRSLARLDWNSRVLWSKKMRFHHDIAIDEDRNIYALARKAEVVLNRGLPVPIFNDSIVVLSPDGEILRKISLYPILREKVPRDRFFKVYGWIIANAHASFEGHIFKIRNRKSFFRYDETLDIFHTNTIEVIGRNIAGLCKKGDLLISSRDLDLVGIVDIEKEKLIWSWGQEELNKPHHPTLLENGNILIFDNGPDRGFSRVIELNPHTKDFVWTYHGDTRDDFYSHIMGSNQRLPNGNTLIAESAKGHAFEITSAGEVVWEFYNPDTNTDEGERRSVYRMTRIVDPKNNPALRVSGTSKTHPKLASLLKRFRFTPISVFPASRLLLGKKLS